MADISGTQEMQSGKLRSTLICKSQRAAPSASSLAGYSLLAMDLLLRVKSKLDHNHTPSDVIKQYFHDKNHITSACLSDVIAAQARFELLAVI